MNRGFARLRMLWLDRIDKILKKKMNCFKKAMYESVYEHGGGKDNFQVLKNMVNDAASISNHLKLDGAPVEE